MPSQYTEELKKHPKEEILALLLERTSPAVAAGILGNIDVETGGTYDYRQKQIGGGKGRGLFQMGDGMLEAYQKYLKKEGAKDSAASQIDFMGNILVDDEIYDIGAGHRKHIQGAFERGDVDEITAMFSDRVLRPGKPHMQRRFKAAHETWESIKGAGNDKRPDGN
jgi:hypothetical protein